MSAPETEHDRGMRRARSALARPGAWLDADGADYLVRPAGDRRRRPLLRLDEEAFRALAAEPGLAPRPDGGWRALAARAEPPSPPPGRPGVIPGERAVTEPDGRAAVRAANLGESPVMWLLRRGWLTPAEAAAGERLRDDHHRAGLLGRLTASWDAGPRAAGGRAPGLDPAERNRAAKARVAAALAAVGPRHRPVLEQVCLAGSALQAAERALGLPRRGGKAALKAALARLAAHYGVG